MRYSAFWLTLVACVLASGFAIAPRWPNTLTAMLTPAEPERPGKTRSLVDAWGDDEDDLRPYETAELRKLRATEPDDVCEREPDAEAVAETEQDTELENLVEPDCEIEATDKPASTTKPALATRQPAEPTSTSAAQPIDEAYLDTVDQSYGAAAQYLDIHDQREEIATPQATERSRFRYGDGEDDLDRFNRRLEDVPLDARPIEGTMPTPPAIAEHADRPRWIEMEEGDGVPLTVVSYSPWTICYRPLYFEEINLERYGCSAGLVQPALSGAHFFGSVALMPYKMAVWPPRSCVCSNGFSRCEDCRPPGYRECVWSWTAAAVEAGVVAGIAVALPW